MIKIQLIVNIIASLNAFILFGLLCFRRSNVLPNYMLAGIMAVPGLYFANSILMIENTATPWLFFLVQFCAIFYAPFYSVYVYSILGKPIIRLMPIFIISIVIGLIPCYLAYVYYAQYDIFQQQNFFTHLVEGSYPKSVMLYSLVFYSFQQIVFVRLFISVNNVRKKAFQFYSNIDQFKINYLLYLTTLLMVLNLSIVVLYVVFDVLFVEYILLPLIISAIYVYIVYYAFKNYGIFTKKDYQIHLNQVDTLEAEIEMTFPQQESSNFLVKLDNILIEQSLVTDPELTLKKLAQAFDLPIHELSKLIRTELNSNFYDVVNSRRIELAKKKLVEEKKYTVEGIGYEVGFNSRASFYRAFKKYTGMTPGKFVSNE